MSAFAFLSRSKENGMIGPLKNFCHSRNNKDSKDFKMSSPLKFNHNIQVRFEREKNEFTAFLKSGKQTRMQFWKILADHVV
jgi:hypothetical protein